MSINQYSLLIHYIIKRFVEFGQLHCKIMDLHWAILCTDVLMLFVVCSLTQSNVTGDRWQVNWSSLESSFFFKVLPKASKLVPHVSLVVPIFVLLFIFSGNPSEQPCQPSENPVHPSSFTWIYILFKKGHFSDISDFFQILMFEEA